MTDSNWYDSIISRKQQEIKTYGLIYVIQIYLYEIACLMTQWRNHHPEGVNITMSFAEKLSFLMHITETSNKELAAALSVDPSLVSLMRTGKRKLSKNPAHAKNMAFFFAKRSSAAFQRQALSEMLGQVAISPGMPTSELADRLESWLRGENDVVNVILKEIQALPAKKPEIQASDSSPAPENQTLFFYGEEGRREVMRRVMQAMRHMEHPGSVLTIVDDNLEWLLSDYLASKQIQSDLLEMMERGFTFYQIMPPLNYINRYTESLQFWLPVYAGGRMKVYYYPRLRGNLYRHSIIIVPGLCVQYSSSVALGSTSDITMFSTDLTLVNAFEEQFREHISLCRPALISHTDPKDSLPYFKNLSSQPGDIIQMVTPLSINSIPKDLLNYYIENTDNPGWKFTFEMYLENAAAFEKSLKDKKLIDLSSVATAEEVRAGKVYVASSFPTYPDHPRYTPETYALHLQNILRLMDQYENYYFLPYSLNDQQFYNLTVSEGGQALLIRTRPPFLMLELRRPEMITAFREHLLRKAEAIGYDGIHREKVRMKLRALIQELIG